MIKHLKFLVVAAGMALALPSPGGDIYEIRRCDSSGAAIAAEWTIDNPLTVAGEKLYFMVRLMNRYTAGTGYRKWGLNHIGTNSEIVDDALNPLAIGIYVSGQVQYARLVNIDASRTEFTDLIFTYETQSGDFALPVLLATEGGKPAGHQGAGAQYAFDPFTTGKWEIRQLVAADTWATGDDALVIWSQGEPAIPVTPPEGARETDTTLEKCGFYVQTIDFDRSLWATEDTVWREVHQDSNVSKPGDPALAAPVALATARKLYVWSADDAIVKAAAAGGVQEVMIAKGALAKSFKIYGVAQNNSTELYLSAFPGKNFNQSGAEIVDYIKIPVRCIEPQPATLSVTPSTTAVTVDGDYMTSKATLNIALSQAYPAAALKIRVKPTFNDGTDDNIGDYVRFSTVGTEVTVLPTFAIPEVTIPAGSTSPQQIHVFFLKADQKTYGTSGRLKFTPEIVDNPTADAEITNKEPGGIAATAAKPVIVTPADNAEVGGTCGEDFDFTVEVSDTYADMDYFDATGASGYQIFVKNRPSDAFKPLAGFYYVGENGQLFLVKEETPGVFVKSGKLPQLNYPVSSGDDYFVSQVYVKSPLSGKQSENRSFRAKIGAPRTSTLEITDLVDGVVKTTYKEGEYLSIKVSLSEVNDTGSSIYAYLLPNDGARQAIYKGTTMFVLKGGDAAADSTVKGLEIKKNQREATGRIMLLDGASEADGGKQISFEVVLTSSPSYNPATKLDGYESNFIDITVNNVEPLIKRLEMNGFESEHDLFTYPQSLPRGMERKFKAVVSDAGSFDLDNDFKTKWTVYCNGVQKHNETIPGNPNEDANVFVYSFNQAGSWTVKAQVKDKDMEDWSATTYSVIVTVVAQPQVVLKVAEEGYSETGKKQYITVGFDFFEATAPLVVRVTVDPPATTAGNLGLLKLDQEYTRPITGYPPLDPNQYYITLNGIGEERMLIAELDGTELSSSKGFSVKAEVVTRDTPTDDDKYADAGGVLWSDYYLPASEKAYVENEPPVVVVTPENTNAWTVAGGLATSYPIRWQVRSDVDADFTGITEFPGIKVSFTGADNDGSEWVTEAKSGVFTPNFGSSQGDRTVTMTIEDKDGGIITKTYLYTITPSKFLVTVPNGPSGQATDLSLRYRLADGIGQGRIYVPGTILSLVENFRGKWNCSKNPQVAAYGYGYRVATPDDDGTLNGGKDVAIDPNGDSVTAAPGNYYRYPLADDADEAARCDSFLYGWLSAATDDNGNAQSQTMTIAVEIPQQAAVPMAVSLPTKENDDGGYLDTTIEAVFAKEWRPADNAGDINQDGVPDLFAIKTWKGGKLINLVYGTDDAENDLADLAESNPDEDYLPGVWEFEGEQTLVDGATSSYAPVGVKFTTLRELRGYGMGLNATDSGIASEPDLTDVEKTARQKYYEAHIQAGADPEIDPAVYPDADSLPLTIWSPLPGSAEYPRMDPTLEDTDGDLRPDGWEYYFWYQAHVMEPAGEAKPRDGQTYVFERMKMALTEEERADPAKVEWLLRAFSVEGEKIDAAEVEARFNPCVKLDVKAAGYNDDFDRDGLSDYEEMLIGTNPCHWDTDGDHMGDGWEVMSALDPLNGGQYGNPDGDFMAFHDMYKDLIWEDGGKQYSLQGLAAYIDYDPLTMITLRDLNKVQAFTFESTGWLYGRVEDAPDKITADAIYHRTLGRALDRVVVPHIAKGTALGAGADLILIHDQVHKAFGFDPRTGWYDTGTGYVASRWDPTVNKSLLPEDTTGQAVNTRAYCNYDEYLAMRYRYLFYNRNDEYYWAKETSTEGLGGDSAALWGYIRSKTTMPSVVLSTNSAITNETVDAEGNTTNTIAEVTEDTPAMDIAKKLAELFQKAGSDKAVRMVHGADTDEDGVPDGWELYMYRDPCAAPAVDEDGAGLPGAADWDGDTLSWAQEFAGTDSCNAYKDCPSIYKNHPGNNSGWFNKFFPTDPGTFNKLGMGPLDGSGVDTDGDGINDAAEGSTWKAVFYNGSKVFQNVEFGFIYGDPKDDGSCCIRGGGMNPCTIDTDLDGLPDGWEMQFAGVPVDASTLRPVGKSSIEIADSTFIADGLMKNIDIPATNSSVNATAPIEIATNTIYLAGGMDATWGGDACTDLRTASYDSLLGKVRDVDFDHDGLQNYQEYLVQSMRHFRYDDISTPLMGRLMSGADGQHAQTFIGYVPFNASDPDQFMISVVENCGPQFNLNPQDFVKIVTVTTGVHVATTPDGHGGVTTNVTYYTADQKQLIRDLPSALAERLVASENDPYRYPWTVDGWRQLGYFAPPVKAFDRATQSGNFSRPLYMLPITGSMCLDGAAAGYVSTDPRMADTDQDGMDDYWELFHGLNPLLGTSADNPSDSHYANGKSGDIVSAVIWMSVYPLQRTTPTYNGFFNEWIYPAFKGADGRTGVKQDGLTALKAPLAYDPVLYPWALGSYLADADGDGLRNGDECILANQASPQPSHTDPSPLWFTESSTKMSYVWQYYNMPPFVADMFATPDYPDAVAEVAARGGASSMYSTYVTDSDDVYICAFEENEGYDTDGDWQADNREMITTTRAWSDPLVFGDPARRQALYLDGDKSYAMSRAMHLRTLNSFDLLRQFTVECWVRPELAGRAQTIVERSCAYPGSAIIKDAVAIRANFRIGLDANGTVYGLFDNSDAVESGQNAPASCQRVDGGTLPLEKWSHVALTYDGKELAIYVNGVKRATAQTTLIPANGVYNIVQNLERLGGFPYEKADATAAAFFIGARPVKENLNALYPYFVSDGVHRESFNNLREYYKGYVDEVRVWDGARSAAQIEANYRVRMTFDDVRANRDEVYLSWYGEGPAVKRKVDGTGTIVAKGGTRNDNDGRPMLPPELLFHYNFQTLPAAAKRSNVASTPTGFAKAVAESAENNYAANPDIGEQVNQLYPLATLKGGVNGQTRDRLRIGWWNESLVKSTAYRDTRVIPWIQNMVAHLEPLDGSCIDSFYYGTELAAQYLPSSEAKVDSFSFPNTAIPYGWIAYGFDRYNRYFAYMRLAVQIGEQYVANWARYAFRVRTDFLNTTDLLPLGGAYAKLCPDYWDGTGPMDVWENTGSDFDADGLPDWWEEYARANYCENLSSDATLDWNTQITYNGVLMPAWMAYMLDLNSGMQPDGSIREDLAQTTDADNNNIPDWWEKLYGLEGCDPNGDADNDGLSNYAEYLISFGPAPYGYNRGWPLLSPRNAKSSLGQQVLDYYLPGPTRDIDVNGKHISAYSYLGEIVTDHDFMENWWERLYGVDYVNAYVYDPQRDADGDGWSNFAENKAYVWGGAFSADLIDRYLDSNNDNHLKCSPQPAVGFKITYFGTQDVSGKGLLVRASSANSKRVDATFTVNGTGSDANNSGYGRTKILGGYSHDTTIRGFLHPGNIVPGDDRFKMCRMSGDRTYVWHIKSGTNWIDYRTGPYSQYIQDVMRYGRDNVILDETNLEFVDFTRSVSDSVGNYGEIRLAVTNVTSSAIIGKINYRTGEYSIDLSKVAAAGIDLDGYVFRADYSYKMSDEWPKTVWVSEPSQGWLKEGVNTFEVSIDLDGNGQYDVGEPYGVATGVDVGWSRRGPITIELTDEATNFGRVDVGVGDGAISQQVVVRRTTINGQSEIDGKKVPQRTLGSRLLVAGNREYITEADILTADKPDLDWKWLVRDAERLGLDQSAIRQVGYDIEVRTDLGGGVTTNMPVSSFYIDYGTSSRPRPVAQSPVANAPVYSAQPTFVFSSNDELMHAYRLQIADSATNIVYDSGAVRLPGRANWTSGTPAYQVSPVVYANCQISTKDSPVLMDGKSYFWRVMLMNAKYNTEDDAAYSAWTEFQFDLANANRHPQTPTGYGNCAAVVRYYGVAQTNDLAGAVVVEAFASPDFSGDPLARVRLDDVAQLSDGADITTTNAVLRGIAPGEVYLRAYIDFNDNGVKDDWESWGYTNYADSDEKAIYKPRAIEVTDVFNNYPSLTIFIEDCDVNQNEIPDPCDQHLGNGSGSGSGSGGGSGGGGIIGSDGDGDGLSDDEEGNFATDPAAADTDGDGMPDGWEALFADTDPTYADGDEMSAGDVMAYAEVQGVAVTLDDGSVYLLEDGARMPQVGDLANGVALRTTYAYNRLKGYGLPAVVADGLRVAGVATNTTVVLVHAQVYERFGFNPMTANPAASSNEWVNTKPFTALDKYLVVRYLEALGLADEDAVNRNRLWDQYTLKPGDPDCDRDGVPDGWELYVMFGRGGVTDTLAAAKVTPWDATPDNVRDPAKAPDGGGLSILDEFDRGQMPTDPWNIDTDGDRVTDKYAYLYHLKGEMAREDADGDGLSNYAEYLITEVFQFARLDPDNAMTDGSTRDYFRKVGELYLGEIFSDHDQVDNAWERRFEKANSLGKLFANSSVYDPDLDLDGDGWPNYDEARAGTDPDTAVKLGIDGYQLTEHPVPVVEMNIVYNGPQAFTGALKIQAWNQARDPKLERIPCAAWTVGRVATTTTTSQNGTTTGTDTAANEKYVGMQPHGTRTYHLGPGMIRENSFKLYFKDTNFVKVQEVTIMGEVYYQPVSIGLVEDALWYYMVVDQGGKLVTTGGVIADSHEVGTIDYKTGKVTINFDDPDLTRLQVADPGVAQSAGGNNGNNNGLYDGINLDQSYVKMEWVSSSVGSTLSGTYYLGDPDQSSVTPNSVNLLPGLTTFTAELTSSNEDTDTADTTTAKQRLFGVVRDVEVGWAGAKATIELTDYSSITPRLAIWDGTADRTATLSDFDPRVNTATNLIEASPAVETPVRVRVARYAVNGWPAYQVGINPNYATAGVVYDAMRASNGRMELNEADFLADGSMDIDWADFEAGVAKNRNVTQTTQSVTNMTYLVVLGDGKVGFDSITDKGPIVALGMGGQPLLIERRFDVSRARPALVDPNLNVYSARPTFTWTMPGESAYAKRYGSSYTAFQILVLDANDDLVWDSGIRRAPAADALGRFSWTAPLSAGELAEGGVIKTATNYTWTVTMFNSKFKTADSEGWSDFGKLQFLTNVQSPMNDHGYSTIYAAVKYAGPSAVLAAPIRLQAFANADCAGDPLAETLVDDLEDVTDLVDVAPNAEVRGLPANGEYYLRAFIDTNGNGVKDDWESYGQTSEPVVLAAATTVPPVVAVWIEDADTDGDWIPDAYEMQVKGNLTDMALSADGDGLLVLKTSAYVMVTNGTAGVSTGLPGASFTAMQSADFVSALLGIASTDSTRTSIEIINDAVAKKVVPNTVRVTSFVLDPAAHKVILAVEADVAAGIAGEWLERWYSTSVIGASVDAVVTVKVFRKSSLAEAGWTEIYSKAGVSLGTEAAMVEVDLNLSDEVLSSGFFKIEVVQ